MQDLRVTLVQANQIWENKFSNLENYTRLLTDYVETDLIVLPEMFHTSFSMNAENLAEKMEDSIGLEYLKKLSREKNAAVYTSLIIEDTGNFYNRGVFVYPSGEVATYDKRRTFGLAGEDKVYTAGSQKKIVEYKGWKLQLQICYDLRFPEIARNELDANQSPSYDVLIYVANWPEKRAVHWKTLLTARAIENQCYVIGLNRVGEDGKGLVYSGDSQVSNALGEVFSLESKKEQLEQFVFNQQSLTQIRNDLPFLKDILR
jgi:predicted amidohydrolase